MPNIGPLNKVIPLKLFLDIVPSSSADITRASRGYFRGGFVYVLSFQRKTSDAVRCLLCVLITSKGALVLGMF